MATIAFLVLLCVVFRFFNCLARGIAQRQLDSHRVPSSRRPARRRVPPPVTQARLLLSAGEWPTAALALLAGRRTRARLRLILAMRRDQSLDRYYAQLGKLHDDRLAETRPKPARVKTPGAFEDPAGALEFAIVAMFAIPPAALGAVLAGPPAMPVVHLDGVVTEHWRRRWEQLGCQVLPPEGDHPTGRLCLRRFGVAAPEAEAAEVRAQQMRHPGWDAARARVEYQRYLECELHPEDIPELPFRRMLPSAPMGLGRWTTPTYRPDDDRWLP
jgi:hypothetical protein